MRPTRTRPWTLPVHNDIAKRIARAIRTCRDCGEPIVLIDALEENGACVTQIIDPNPRLGGWVWVGPRGLAAVRRFPPFPTEWVPYKRHGCRGGDQR